MVFTSEEMNEVYRQRAIAAALAAAFAQQAGCKVARKKDSESGWWCLYIETKNGQVSWHYHPDQVHLISDFLVDEDIEWDGKFSGRDEGWAIQTMVMLDG